MKPGRLRWYCVTVRARLPQWGAWPFTIQTTATSKRRAQANVRDYLRRYPRRPVRGGFIATAVAIEESED